MWQFLFASPTGDRQVESKTQALFHEKKIGIFCVENRGWWVGLSLSTHVKHPTPSGPLQVLGRASNCNSDKFAGAAAAGRSGIPLGEPLLDNSAS